MSPADITLWDVWQSQQAAASQITALTAEVRHLAARADEHHEDDKRDLADKEQRIRALEAAVPQNLESRLSAAEQFRWKFAGALVIISMAVSALMEWLVFARH